MNDFWVFGYGSLMWKPGFIYGEKKFARLYGYCRSLCIYSHYHRGTKEQPGLVLGLNRGGSCPGVAFHVKRDVAEQAYNYLRKRERPDEVYHEKMVKLVLEDGRRVDALAFVANAKHAQYAAGLTLDEMVTIIQKSSGVSGKNCEYVINTVDLLNKHSMRDPKLEKIAIQFHRVQNASKYV